MLIYRSLCLFSSLVCFISIGHDVLSYIEPNITYVVVKRSDQNYWRCLNAEVEEALSASYA